jgi:hypothetical protein
VPSQKRRVQPQPHASFSQVLFSLSLHTHPFSPQPQFISCSGRFTFFRCYFSGGQKHFSLSVIPFLLAFDMANIPPGFNSDELVPDEDEETLNPFLNAGQKTIGDMLAFATKDRLASKKKESRIWVTSQDHLIRHVVVSFGSITSRHLLWISSVKSKYL